MTDQEIEYSIKTNRLPLNNRGKIKHYGLTIFLVCISVFALMIFLADFPTVNSKNSRRDIFYVFVISLILGFLFFKIQTYRLKFKSVETKLSRSELGELISLVSKDLRWTIITDNDKIVEAKTYPSFFSGSWGEQITILFDNKKILVNSICDLDQPSSVVSMGRNKKNTNRLLEEIRKACR